MTRKILWMFLAILLVAGVPGAVALQETDNPDVEEFTIPEGTEFKLQLHTSINSKTSKPGDRVVTTLLDPVPVEDTEVLGRGLRIDGHIGEVRPARRRGKGGYLTIVFDTVELASGEKVAILGSLTEIFSSEGKGEPNVGPEGELKGRGPSRKKQTAVILLPTAAAAAAGAGPAIVAGTSATVAAIFIPHGKQAGLTAGSLIGMRLDRDVTIKMPATPGK